MNQGEMLMDATPRRLESTVVYTVVNKAGSHAIGLKGWWCIKTLLYCYRSCSMINFRCFLLMIYLL